jgi:hypothetical protein
MDLLLFIGDVLRVDPSMIPKIFQVLYDSEGQTLLNNSTTTMSSSMIQPQVNTWQNMNVQIMRV